MSWAFTRTRRTRPSRDPRVAFLATALAGVVWLNQGPSARRYDELARDSTGLAVRAWLPFAFAYRRAVDEELYYATANAIRGVPFDRTMLAARRGDVPDAFRRLPPTDGRWHMPYADVPFEYPALILPFILLPAMVSPTFDVFAVVSGALMAGLLLASIALAIRTRGGTDADRATRWWMAGALLLAQGGLAIQRVDAVPTVFLALALWAAADRRAFVMGLGVALAAAAKITPLFVLFPMMAADREAWRTPGALARVAGGLALGLGVGFLPMLASSPGGFASFVGYHQARGLQVESTYGAILSVAELLGGHPRGATLSFGSYNLDGDAARWFASASTPILLVALALFTAWVWRRPAPTTDADRVDALACAGLGAMVSLWLFSKVFSPQYMTWAIPFAVAVSARTVAAALVAAMALAQTYLRGFYDHVVDMRPDGVVALVARLAALVALAVLVIRAFPPRAAASPRLESVP